MWCAFLCVVVSIGKSEELYTNVYVVPPTFLEQRDNLPTMPEAKAILEAAGIQFSQGTSAIFNPKTSQLIVRNTEDQMELVEAYIDSLKSGVAKQIHISVREATFDPKNSPELLKWIVSGPLGGTGRIELPSQAKSEDPIRDFENKLSRPPLTEDLSSPPSQRGIAGVFTDPQFQVLIREIEKNEEIGYLQAPSTMCRSGQPALVQVKEKRWGVIPVIGSDEFTIDLTLYLPSPGKALPNGHPSNQVTIWDGQTVAYAEDLNDGTRRISFITARLVDAAGKAIIPEKKKRPEPLSEADSKRVEKADEAALAGSQALSDENYKEAEKRYQTALDLLPSHELTKARREAYEKQFVLIRKKLLEQRQQAGISSFRTHIVQAGETLHDIARRYDLSVSKLEGANRLASNTIRLGQLLIIPESPSDSRLGKALKTLIIPKIEWRDVPLQQGLGQIQSQILQTTEGGLFPDIKCEMILEIPKELLEGQITLRLTNVPATEALRYTTALARCRYELRGNSIVILPEKE